MENTFKYKYKEDKALEIIAEYINSTYGQHYVGDGEIQTVDFWKSLGSLDTTARDTAIKYLARYGKKDGKNRKDLLKAIHYIILMMYALNIMDDEEEQHPAEQPPYDNIVAYDIPTIVEGDANTILPPIDWDGE